MDTINDPSDVQTIDEQLAVHLLTLLITDLRTRLAEAEHQLLALQETEKSRVIASKIPAPPEGYGVVIFRCWDAKYRGYEYPDVPHAFPLGEHIVMKEDHGSEESFTIMVSSNPSRYEYADSGTVYLLKPEGVMVLGQGEWISLKESCPGVSVAMR